MKKFILLIGVLFASIQLSGCATGIIVAGVSALASGGMTMVNERRDTDVPYNDKTISDTINELIKKEPSLHNTRIQADSYNQTVLLTGEARKPSQRRTAVKLAQRIRGVYQVYDQMLAFYPRSEAQAHNDLLINTRVQTTLLAYEGINISLTKVSVNHGIVYVRGLVTQTEGRNLIHRIRQVTDVKQVVDLFEYVRFTE